MNHNPDTIVGLCEPMTDGFDPYPHIHSNSNEYVSDDDEFDFESSIDIFILALGQTDPEVFSETCQEFMNFWDDGNDCACVTIRDCLIPMILKVYGKRPERKLFLLRQLIHLTNTTGTDVLIDYILYNGLLHNDIHVILLLTEKNPDLRTYHDIIKIFDYEVKDRPYQYQKYKHTLRDSVINRAFEMLQHSVTLQSNVNSDTLHFIVSNVTIYYSKIQTPESLAMTVEQLGTNLLLCADKLFFDNIPYSPCVTIKDSVFDSLTVLGKVAVIGSKDLARTLFPIYVGYYTNPFQIADLLKEITCVINRYEAIRVGNKKIQSIEPVNPVSHGDEPRFDV